jgi:uncharacterized protein (DUF1015 family)
MFIADGHHRYETACDYRDERAADGPLTPDHPTSYCLMMCVGMSDPGMIVLPTHRLFRGLEPIHSAELQRKLSPCFDLRPLGDGPQLAESIWQRLESAQEQSQIALFAGGDHRWVLAELNASGRQRMVQLATDRSDEWRSLGVSILQKLVLEDLLNAGDLPKPMYVHSASEVMSNLLSGDVSGRDATGQQGTGKDFPLAALVMPPTLDHVQSVSEQGERMPAKSTYFYPKLLAGLVINLLD